jgi:energy-coupling factor transporter ATP-binding protein EcfA2
MDHLDRRNFTKRAAELCRKVASEADSSIVSLIGPWGSGKTSLINFIKNDLRKQEGENWRFAEFNPWQFADTESLLRSFFVTLAKELPGDKRRALRRSLARHLKNIAPAGKAAPLKGTDKVLEAISNVLHGDDSVEHTWDVVHKLLGKTDTKLLVVIDDVDRLQPAELLTLLKLVRVVGRFPNVYYLIAYDEETLIDVLSTTDLAKGDKARATAYLEKIVQVRLDLPPISYDIQSKFIEKHLNHSIGRLDQEISESDLSRLRKALDSGMRRRLTTPRSIRRLFAQVNSAFEGLQGEVNYVDFVILTYLRTFESTLYHALPKYRDELVGVGGRYTLGSMTRADDTIPWKKRVKEAGISEESVDILLRLLAEVFLCIKSSIDKTTYGDNWYLTLRKERRACTPDYFDRYFNFGLPETDVSDVMTIKALKHLIEGQRNDHAIAELKKLLNGDPLPALDKIHSMMDHVQSINPEPLLNLLKPIFAEHERDLRFLGSPPDVIRGIAIGALERTTLATAMRAYHTLFTPEALRLACGIAVVATRGTPQNEMPEWLKRFNQDLIPHLRSAVLNLAERPLDSISDQEFLLLYWLHDLDKDYDARGWTRHVLTQGVWAPEDFLARLVPIRVMYGTHGPIEKLGAIDVSQIDRMIGLEYAMEIAEPYLSNAFPNPNTFVEADVSYLRRKEYVLAFLKDHKEKSAAETDPEDGGDN